MVHVYCLPREKWNRVCNADEIYSEGCERFKRIHQSRKIRKRGVFIYDPVKDEIGICPEDITPPKPVKRVDYCTIGRKQHSLLLLRFGCDIFFFDTFLKKLDFYEILDSIPYGNKGTLHVLVAFYALSSIANYGISRLV